MSCFNSSFLKLKTCGTNGAMQPVGLEAYLTISSRFLILALIFFADAYGGLFSIEALIGEVGSFSSTEGFLDLELYLDLNLILFINLLFLPTFPKESRS